MLDEVQRGVQQLRRIVRRDGGRHADRDTLGAVGEQIREGRRQDAGFFLRAVIGGPKSTASSSIPSSSSMAVSVRRASV